MPWRFKNVPLMYSKEKCQRNRYSREEVPEDFDTVVQRCNYGSSPVDGKHPYGCPPNQTFILFQKRACGGKKNLHAPAGQSADKEVFCNHICMSLLYKIMVSVCHTEFKNM